MKKSKFREPGGSKKKKNDAVAAGTGEVVKAELVERPREYVVTLHFPEVRTCSFRRRFLRGVVMISISVGIGF